MTSITDKEYATINCKIPLYIKYNGINFFLFSDKIGKETFVVGYRSENGVSLSYETGESASNAAYNMLAAMKTRWEKNLGISIKQTKNGDYVVA